MCPAPAGMSLSDITPRLAEWHVPRASGDEPGINQVKQGIDKCAPRQRG